MKKISYGVGLIAVALPALILLGAGCSPSDKIAEKITEKALEKASGNKVKVDLNSDGGVTVKGKEGSLSVGGNGSRPESAPEDLPSVQGAKNFFWLGSSGSGMFSYEVSSNDFKAICAAQLDLLAKAGWQKSDAYEMDVEKMMSKSLAKPDFALSITCSDSTDDGSTDYKVGIVLNKNKR